MRIFPLLLRKIALLTGQKSPALANNSKTGFLALYPIEKTRLFVSPCAQTSQKSPAKPGFFQFFPV
jgi:hypothetical protein